MLFGGFSVTLFTPRIMSILFGGVASAKLRERFFFTAFSTCFAHGCYTDIVIYMMPYNVIGGVGVYAIPPRNTTKEC